ncbi:hypothetical protein MPER_02782 [Moniliophthora perniciosa FA553]|nr:hypothetical protein MPER_02782 [Moniliophthora perniciosa FA553]
MYTPLCGVRDVYFAATTVLEKKTHSTTLKHLFFPDAITHDLNSIIDGMGTWDQKVLEPLKADAKAIQERVQLYLEAQERVGTRPNGMVTAASIQLCETLSYLGSLALPYSRARELWSFCQRWYLELHAALDWIQLCKPAMENQSDYDRAALASVTKKAMGAFLFTVKDCEHFFRAGIPFWILASSSKPFQVKQSMSYITEMGEK